jgi:uncharacterized protein
MLLELKLIENPRFKNLMAYLKKLRKVAIAFSGGVDSSFLLAVAKMSLGHNVVAITIDSPAFPGYELSDSKKLAKLLDVKHLIIKSDSVDEAIMKNPVNRCFYCKRFEYTTIKDQATKLGMLYVLDGSNADDLKDYHKGMKATQEVRLLSPLLENRLTKEEIRNFSRILGLPTWDKPSFNCLYSRIPIGQEIKKEHLVKIEKSEMFFIKKGIRSVRVYCHNDLARIEANRADFVRICEEPLKTEIVAVLKSFGFEFVTVDLLRFKYEYFNESILRNEKLFRDGINKFS